MRLKKEYLEYLRKAVWSEILLNSFKLFLLIYLYYLNNINLFFPFFTYIIIIIIIIYQKQINYKEIFKY